MSTTRPPPSTSPLFWPALVIGSVIAGWGVVLFLDAVPHAGQRLSFALWIVGADLAHDLVVAPLVIAIGWLSSRLLPPSARVPVQVGLATTGTVVLVGWLPLVGSAAYAGNPTIQPLDYPTAVATALGLVWGAIGVWMLAGWWVRHRRPR